jgi:glycosyltransferase involved in cell wall biosynthesis
VKILFLSITSEIGGADLALLRTVQNLSRPEFEAAVALPGDGPLAGKFRAAGAEVHFVPMRRMKNTLDPLWHLRFLTGYPGVCRRIAELAREVRADVIHSNTLPMVYGSRAARLAGLPHVWEVREMSLRPAAVQEALAAMALRGSSRIVAMSGSIAREVFGGPGGTLPPHLSVIYGSVDLERFRPDPAAGARLRERFNLPPESKVAGIWCRFDEWKGIPVAIRAAGLLAREVPGFRLLVAGGPTAGHEDYAEWLRELAGRTARDSIVFTGWLAPEDSGAFVAGLDVAIHASTRPEPFGLVIAEAMSCGTPLVAPRLGSPLELVEDGVDGVLYAPGQPKELAAAVRRLLDEPALREKCARAGREKAERLFDVRKNVRQLEDIYRGLARKSAP